MFGEDAYLDTYMEDYISAGYAQPSYSWDPYYDRDAEYTPYSDWDEDEIARGFDEAHARSEEEDYITSWSWLLAE